MFYKFLISIFIVLFVAACATKPKESAASFGFVAQAATNKNINVEIKNL